MAASFPNTKKTFTAIVNGVTKLVAALFNTPDDEIEAIETFVGAMGVTQAGTESMKNGLKNYRRGCEISYKSAADLYVRLGEIVVSDASGNRTYRVNTSDLTVAWANIDTGSEANSTMYYIYAVADATATTFTVLISTNATTPTGATFYRNIGSFYNDASGNIQIGQDSAILGSLPIKAFICFNGSGTIAIKSSYNVASIADGGTGIYTITWAVAFADANYVCVASQELVGATTGYSIAVTDKAAGSIKVKVQISNSGVYGDATDINVIAVSMS